MPGANQRTIPVHTVPTACDGTQNTSGEDQGILGGTVFCRVWRKRTQLRACRGQLPVRVGDELKDLREYSWRHSITQRRWP